MTSFNTSLYFVHIEQRYKGTMNVTHFYSAFQLFKKPLCSTFIFFCEIINAQLNAERSAEILFNLLDVDNNGDINEEEFIRS